jgi:2-hydroxy-3-keto-5-methylthiopentenyl-1-phosphate phosphatase
MSRNIAVFTDFDGTLTYRNVLDCLYENFAAPNHRDFVRRWEQGEISIQEELEGCFATIKASRNEMELFLDRVCLRPGLPDLIKYCQKRTYDFAILSEGLSWYIDYILRLNGIFDVMIFANHIHFCEDWVRFSFPWFDPLYPLRGTSKASIIRKYQGLGSRVIFIGDGLSDTDAAEAADIVFARDHLQEYTARHGIDSFEFSTIPEIIKHLERLV